MLTICCLLGVCLNGNTSYLISAASAESRSLLFIRQTAISRRTRASRHPNVSMSSSPKIHADGQELLRFAKNTSSLIRDVLEKVHRIPSNRLTKKKTKRAKKSQLTKVFATESVMTDTSSYQMPAPDMGIQRESFVPEQAAHGFDLPLCYFMNNLYEDSELSVENLLPSLRPEDFCSPPSAPTSTDLNHHYHTNTQSSY